MRLLLLLGPLSLLLLGLLSLLLGQLSLLLLGLLSLLLLSLQLRGHLGVPLSKTPLLQPVQLNWHGVCPF